MRLAADDAKDTARTLDAGLQEAGPTRRREVIAGRLLK
jgi:hypothetical protein